jgi:hypothetical protein
MGVGKTLLHAGPVRSRRDANKIAWTMMSNANIKYKSSTRQSHRGTSHFLAHQ